MYRLIQTKAKCGTVTEVLYDGEPDLFLIEFDDGSDEIMTPDEFEEVD